MIMTARANLSVGPPYDLAVYLNGSLELDEVRLEAARRYIRNFELVTGRTFEPDRREPVARIAAALGAS